MLTTIIIPAVTGLAGIAIGASAVTAGGLRRRVRYLEGAFNEAVPELITRQEVSNAFAQLAAVEEQRWQQTMMRVQAAPFQMTDPTKAWAQAGNGVAPSAPAPTPAAAPSAAEMNALLTQQLASLNERLQRVGAPRPAAG